MRKTTRIILILLINIVIVSCNTDSTTETSSTTSSSSVPSDHTVNEHGVLHKSGLNDPTTNCVSCHGSDLKGGSSGVSCYSCHGQKW